MYGKAFESMYEGSMVGAGCNVFAVWNYVIAKNRCGVVELNPKLLAFVLGSGEAEILSAIEYLSHPDPGSRSKAEEGRRLIREGEYQYRMVNWQLYDGIKSQAALREYNARKQAEYRAKKRLKNGKPLPGEEQALRRVENGEITQEKADEIASTYKVP
jgi:hypothetical protein